MPNDITDLMVADNDYCSYEGTISSAYKKDGGRIYDFWDYYIVLLKEILDEEIITGDIWEAKISSMIEAAYRFRWHSVSAYLARVPFTSFGGYLFKEMSGYLNGIDEADSILYER
ncbi:MAG: hypothetical protein FWG40_06495 [Peptococcaceae bacterium]|nr:hypothetical protein [Peptococcaceae bacterium]